FVHTQLLLNEDLAEVLSAVFYEGRVKTAVVDEEKEQQIIGQQPVSHTTVNLIDSQKYGPRLSQKDEGRGFSPVNEVHGVMLIKMLKRLVLNNHVDMEEIGIIVPFRSTVYDIRGALYDNGYGEVD